MITELRRKALQDFLAGLKIPFKNIELLHLAFVHSSFANKNQSSDNNQRLEFLGDSVLSLCVSEFIYEKYPQAAEGKLTRIRSYVVSEKTLSELSRKLKFDQFILISWGEENSGGRQRDAILADTFEAFLGALYLDQGMITVKDFLLPLMIEEIDKVSHEEFVYDYKTELQYLIQKKYKKCPEYKVVKEDGPPHNKLFYSELIINDKVLALGVGNSKKKAEQEAAKQILEKIRKENINIENFFKE